MITLHRITKLHQTRSGIHHVLNGIDLTIEPGEKIGILGRNGAGKSTLIRILGGAESPTTGWIHRGMSISWPLAFSGGFQGSLTGLDNLKFISRVYGVDYRLKTDYVLNFSELGKFFYEPVKTYSAGMRARLAFALSMAIEFDCYLIDETLSVGDSRFHKKCEHELFERRKERAMVLVSHHAETVRAHCSTIYVLENGLINKFTDTEQAYEYYNEQQNKNPA